MTRFGASVAAGYREKISTRTAANSSSREPVAEEPVLAEPEHPRRGRAGESGSNDVADPGEVRVGAAAAGEGQGEVGLRLRHHADDRAGVEAVEPPRSLFSSSLRPAKVESFIRW